MRFLLPVGFGTVSSSILALGEPGGQPGAVWRYCTVGDASTPWEPVGLG